MQNENKNLPDLLKHMFENKEYERLLFVCERVSKDHPDYRASQNYSRKAKFMLGNKDVKWAIAFICVAMTVLVSGVVHLNQKIDQELSLKEIQVNSLIDEIGTLKDENNLLNNKITDGENYLNLAINSINNVDDKLNSISDSINKAEAVKSMKTVQNSLSNMLLSNRSAKSGTATTPPEKLITIDKEEYKELTNILILGTHGTLTDTIMVASINPKLQTISLISIPRDLFVHGRKINSVYNLYGANKIAEYITEISGLPINNYVVVNLQGFIEIVDLMGGIDIYNEQDLNDTLYPGPNYTYSTFSLKKGNHHLDGQTALKFARSRKSTSDFDRAKRQQAVIQALINKAKQYDFVENIDRIEDIYKIISKNLITDIGLTDGAKFINNYKSFKLKRGNTIDTSNYLYPNKNIQGQYILLPNKGNYKEIQQYIGRLVLQE
ncbi:LCP family protein [Patescibacteria group bacterium]|nr:LCP family protein [Patescibacteria group bacterium]